MVTLKEVSMRTYTGPYIVHTEKLDITTMANTQAKSEWQPAPHIQDVKRLEEVQVYSHTCRESSLSILQLVHFVILWWQPTRRVRRAIERTQHPVP